MWQLTVHADAINCSPSSHSGEVTCPGCAPFMTPRICSNSISVHFFIKACPHHSTLLVQSSIISNELLPPRSEEEEAGVSLGSPERGVINSHIVHQWSNWLIYTLAHFVSLCGRELFCGCFESFYLTCVNLCVFVVASLHFLEILSLCGHSVTLLVFSHVCFGSVVVLHYFVVIFCHFIAIFPWFCGYFVSFYHGFVSPCGWFLNTLQSFWVILCLFCLTFLVVLSQFGVVSSHLWVFWVILCLFCVTLWSFSVSSSSFLHHLLLIVSFCFILRNSVLLLS